ncbi:MAG: choice-of-anchor D domain-containing protein [Candidatus Cloacimonetes bacterium]|nr:choice-of-anchor D domain-containing protein [Candidatus Cloacimonadota bacterium]
MKRHKMLFILMILGLGVFSSLFAQVDITIGDGTSFNGETSVPAPYGTYYKNFHQQFLYTAEEIEAAGGGAGPINSLAFNVQNINTCFGMPNFTIRIKTTQQNALTTTFEEGEYTEVFYENGFVPVNGWNVHPFISPFDWDGTSNILVDIITTMFEEEYTRNASVYYSTTSFNSALRYQNDTQDAASSPTGTTGTNRSNITFNMTAVQVTDPPSPANLIAPEDGSTLSSPVVTLSWSSGGGLPTGYKLFLGTTNPPEFFEDLGSMLNYYPQNLPFSTTHYWQIVPYNQHGDASDCPVWSFTTMDDPVVHDLPWYDGFETANADNAAIVGWMQEAVSGSNIWTANNSQTTYNRAPRTGSWNAYLRYGNTRWMFKAVELEAETPYRINFYARQDGAIESNASITIAYGNEPSASAMSNILLDAAGLVNGDYQMFEGLFSPAAAGVYYVGILGTINSSPWYISIDDITIEEVSSEPNLVVNPMEWNFDETLINSTASKSFSLMNNGGGTLDVTSVELTGDFFALAEPFSPISLVSGESSQIVVNFSPTTVGEHIGSMIVGAGEQQLTVSLSGSCYDPIISTFPWIEDFGTLTSDWPVLNWTQRGGLYPDASEASTQWYRDDWLNGPTENNAAKINIYGISRKGWLITPPINIPEGEYVLQFDLGLTDYSNSDPIEDPEGQLDDKFIVAISDNPEMSNPSILLEANNTTSALRYNNIPHTGINVIANLSDFSGIKYIAFYGESTQSGGDNDLFVDNVQIRETSTEPLLIVNPTEWSFGEIVIGTTANKSFTISNGGGGTLDVTSVELTGDFFALAEPFSPISLDSGENSSIVVNFSPTAIGEHAGNIVINAGEQQLTVSLTGACYDPIISTFPWLEDFGSSSDEPFVPAEWNQQTGLFPETSGTGTQWVRGDWLFNATENNAAKINVYGTSRYGWLITPPVNLPEGDYYLSFDLALTDWNSAEPSESLGEQVDDRFLILISNSPDMSDPIILREWNNTGSADVFDDIPVTGDLFEVSLSNYNGIHYFAFYAESTEYNGDNDVYLDNVSIHLGPSSGEDITAPALETALKGNYPNPFNPETTIRYYIKDNAPVTLDILNLKGQLVRRLVNSVKNAGEHSVVWNGKDIHGRNVASGMYFYKLSSNNIKDTKKMIMMK